MKTQGIVSVLLILLLLTSVSHSAIPTGWNRSAEIPIQDSLIDSDITDYVMTLTFDMLPAEMFVGGGANASKNDGGDIRFSSDSAGTTEIPREILRFDTTNNIAQIHVKVASVLASGGASVWIWYDNSGASDYAEDATYGRENVYDANFITVHHLEEDPGGGAPQMTDATATDGDGTISGDPTSTAGQVDSALTFDSSDDGVSFGERSEYKLIGDMTWSTWVMLTSAGSVDDIYGIIEGSTGENEADNSIFYLDTKGSSNEWDFNYIHEYGNGTNETHLFDANLNNDVWYHIAITRDVSTDEVKGYKNGILLDIFDYTNDPTNTATDLKYWIAERTSGAQQLQGGTLDEVRLYDAVETAAEINAQYKNQSIFELFAIAGAPFDVPAVGTETFGETGETETNSLLIVADHTVLSKQTMGPTGGMLDSIYVYIHDQGGAPSIKLCIYSAADSSLLAQAAGTVNVEFNTPTYGWQGDAVSVALSANTDYWLGFNAVGATVNFNVVATTGGTADDAVDPLPFLDPFVGGTPYGGQHSIYGVYTPSEEVTTRRRLQIIRSD